MTCVLADARDCARSADEKRLPPDCAGSAQASCYFRMAREHHAIAIFSRAKASFTATERSLRS